MERRVDKDSNRRIELSSSPISYQVPADGSISQPSTSGPVMDSLFYALRKVGGETVEQVAARFRQRESLLDKVRSACSARDWEVFRIIKDGRGGATYQEIKEAWETVADDLVKVQRDPPSNQAVDKLLRRLEEKLLKIDNQIVVNRPPGVSKSGRVTVSLPDK